METRTTTLTAKPGMVLVFNVTVLDTAVGLKTDPITATCGEPLDLELIFLDQYKNIAEVPPGLKYKLTLRGGKKHRLVPPPDADEEDEETMLPIQHSIHGPVGMLTLEVEITYSKSSKTIAHNFRGYTKVFLQIISV